MREREGGGGEKRRGGRGGRERRMGTEREARGEGETGEKG